jgi:hypothetical protein
MSENENMPIVAEAALESSPTAGIVESQAIDEMMPKSKATELIKNKVAELTRKHQLEIEALKSQGSSAQDPTQGGRMIPIEALPEIMKEFAPDLIGKHEESKKAQKDEEDKKRSQEDVAKRAQETQVKIKSRLDSDPEFLELIKNNAEFMTSYMNPEDIMSEMMSFPKPDKVIGAVLSSPDVMMKLKEISMSDKSAHGKKLDRVHLYQEAIENEMEKKSAGRGYANVGKVYTKDISSAGKSSNPNEWSGKDFLKKAGLYR